MLYPRSYTVNCSLKVLFIKGKEKGKAIPATGRGGT
jgi:hypothetical protein